VLPSYGLPRIVAALRQRTWNLNMAEPAVAQQLYDELPRSIGLPSPSELYGSMAEAKYSFEANWGGKIATTPDAGEMNEADSKETSEFFNDYLGGETYLKFVEEQYRRNFKLRVENPMHFITNQSDTLHEPILTFFRDRLSVCTEHLGKTPGLAFGAFQHFCERERGRAYVYECEVSDLTHFQHLFREWCIANGVPADFVDAVLRAQELMQSKASGEFNGEDIGKLFAQFASEEPEDTV